MLHSEFIRTFNGFNRSTDDNSVNKNFKGFQIEEPFAYIDTANAEVAASVDWRDQGAVTGVKDQGHCGKFRKFFSNVRFVDALCFLFRVMLELLSYWCIRGTTFQKDRKTRFTF